MKISKVLQRVGSFSPSLSPPSSPKNSINSSSLTRTSSFSSSSSTSTPSISTTNPISSSISLSSPKNHVHSSSLVRKSSFSSSSTSSDDIILQNSFDDWSKLKLYSSSLFNTSSIKEAEKLISYDVVPGFADAMIVHVDLQNPLLKKYGFDAQEFYTGAKDALYKVWTAASSQSFYEYANNIPSSSSSSLSLSSSCDSADYIRENCHPHVYNSFIEVSQQLKQADIHGISIIDYGFHHMILSGVDTSIVDDHTFGQRETLSLVREMFSSSSSSLSSSSSSSPPPSSSSSSVSSNKKMMIDAIRAWNDTYFPIGSVVATAYIEYESYESANFVIHDHSKVSNKMRSKGMCTFHGCISGQKELEWKLTSLMIK